MNEEQKLEIINYLEKASVAVFCLLFILFPIFFTNLTTDFFNLPKQALVVFATLVIMLLFGVKTLLLEKVRIRKTPFDLPIILFLFALLLSAIFSVAKADSFSNVLPLIFAGLSYFGIVYNVKNEKSVLALIASLLAGASLLSLTAIFTFFKVYIFPFDFAKNVAFTPSGAILDQALYLLFVLPVGLYFLSPFILRKKQTETGEEKKMDSTKLVGFTSVSFIILVGLAVSIYNLIKLPNNLILLPIETGFQTAFAAISQDSGRILQGLLFGNGFGEYLLAFTKFKQASINASPTLWSVSFMRSSTFVLELLATTGILGFFSFLFLCYKVIKEKPLFVPLIIALASAFILPLSFYTLTTIFFLIAIYATLRGLTDNQKYLDLELELVALKKGFIAFSPESEREKGYGKVLAYSIFGVILVLVLTLGYISYDYLAANVVFEKSIVAASQNNGQLTYTYQSNALSSLTGKQIDAYYRVFSQTNLSLANSLASSVPQGASVSAQTQQTIYTLVQQSINAARQATTISPQNTIDWQNFAILAQQQATQLDPVNPQNYITLGGIYYQLGQWDKALAQFQQAATLKPDFANAYYNIGHTLLQKGDLKGALVQLQTVKSLVANDPTNLSKINGEIQALEAQINQQQTTQAQTAPTNIQPALNTPQAATLPPQNPPVKIPAPQATSVTPTGTPTPTTTTSPTPTP
jgi:tetratricopeptide (TPR) repeat protein